MSRENVEAVRRFLDHAAESPDAVWDISDEAVEWELEVAFPGTPQSIRGPDGIRDLFRQWIGAFDDWGYAIEECVDGTDAVAVLIHQWGRGKGSGVPVDNRFWQIWTMRNGKAVRVVHRSDRAVALEVGGIQE